MIIMYFCPEFHELWPPIVIIKLQAKHTQHTNQWNIDTFDAPTLDVF